MCKGGWRLLGSQKKLVIEDLEEGNVLEGNGLIGGVLGMNWLWIESNSEL